MNIEQVINSQKNLLAKYEKLHAVDKFVRNNAPDTDNLPAIPTRGDAN
ncbi:hypothetical protein LCGC14_2234920 [marine sediment metagenome]|uniref:Uncharacterized protein n=1 Tax=marine sediment metagenome TaxID=412755 RepID=A0A0F9FJP3_9ZZZZ